MLLASGSDDNYILIHRLTTTNASGLTVKTLMKLLYTFDFWKACNLAVLEAAHQKTKRIGRGRGHSNVFVLFSLLTCCSVRYRCLTLQGHSMDVLDLDWSPAEMHLLVSGSIDNKIMVWDLSSCYVRIVGCSHNFPYILVDWMCSNVRQLWGRVTVWCQLLWHPFYPPKKVLYFCSCDVILFQLFTLL
jgi:WD40 repeat protein